MVPAGVLGLAQAPDRGARHSRGMSGRRDGAGAAAAAPHTAARVYGTGSPKGADKEAGR